jgi:hypothetical protein
MVKLLFFMVAYSGWMNFFGRLGKVGKRGNHGNHQFSVISCQF